MLNVIEMYPPVLDDRLITRLKTEEEVTKFFDGRVKIAEVETKDLSEIQYAEFLEVCHEEIEKGTLTIDGLKGILTALSQIVKRMYVKPEYRNEYVIRTGGWESCGDEVAKALTAYVTVTDKEGNSGCSYDKMEEVAEANDLSKSFHEGKFYGKGKREGLQKSAAWKSFDPGHCRMLLGNALRGKISRGEEVNIGGQKF